MRILVLLGVVCALCGQVFGQTGSSDVLRVTGPSRWVNDKTYTLKAEFVRIDGSIDWSVWEADGRVTVTRAATGADVPISAFVFDTHDGVPAADTIHFRNGVGSVSISFDAAAAVAAGDVIVTVQVNGLSASRMVSVLSNPTRTVMSGILPDANLRWSPAMGVVHLTGNVVINAGKTLTIDPGTMIMVDPGPANDGTRIICHGRVVASGTAIEPIFFFPSTGVAGLRMTALCSEPVYNASAWRGIVHYNAGPSSYKFVFVTGAGNAPVTGHRRPPILNFTHNHSFDIDDCVFCDNNGKAIYGTGVNNPQYNIRRTLIARCGHGVEFTEDGNYSLLVEDSYFMDVGFAPASCDRNGDHLNIRADIPGNGGPRIVRRCVFAEAGDENIDHKGTHIVMEDCILRGATGNSVSMERNTGGSLTMTDCLVFDSPLTAISAIGQRLTLTNCTIVNARQLLNTDGVDSVVRGCIFSGNRWTACYGSVTNCALPLNSTVLCLLTNLVLNPGLDAATFSFEVGPLSPLRSGNADGSPIGWTSERFDGPRTAPSPPAIAIVFGTATTVPGVGSVCNEDVVLYDTATGAWSMLIDGSDIGLSAEMIDAVAVLPDGDFLLSFSADMSLPNVTGGDDSMVDDADIVRFSPTSLGVDTAGTLTMYFDGSDVGLTDLNNNFDIDALAVDASGALLISTLGNNTVLGATAMDEDILRFVPTSLGASTSGSWSLSVQGARIGLAETADEDVDAIAVGPGASFLLSTLGTFSTNSGVAGTRLDLFSFTPTALGTATSGTTGPFLAPVSLGIDPATNVNATEYFPLGISIATNGLRGNDSSPAETEAGCAADLNDDGIVDELDLFDYLDEYFDDEADGLVDKPGMQEFLTILNAGGCVSSPQP